MSGTQTQISGSSPVKRAPGTLSQLPNPNQQRFCGNDTAWTSAAYTLPSYLSQGLPTSSFASLLPSEYLQFHRHYYGGLCVEYDSSLVFGLFPGTPTDCG